MKSRRDKLEHEHQEFLAAVATSKALVRLQSTIAGAGGKTNETFRRAEAREEHRMRVLVTQEKQREEQLNFEQLHTARKDSLRLEELRKKGLRNKKKSRKISSNKRSRSPPQENCEDECNHSATTLPPIDTVPSKHSEQPLKQVADVLAPAQLDAPSITSSAESEEYVP